MDWLYEVVDRVSKIILQMNGRTLPLSSVLPPRGAYFMQRAMFEGKHLFLGLLANTCAHSHPFPSIHQTDTLCYVFSTAPSFLKTVISLFHPCYPRLFVCTYCASAGVSCYGHVFLDFPVRQSFEICFVFSIGQWRATIPYRVDVCAPTRGATPDTNVKPFYGRCVPY